MQCFTAIFINVALLLGINQFQFGVDFTSARWQVQIAISKYQIPAGIDISGFQYRISSCAQFKRKVCTHPVQATVSSASLRTHFRSSDSSTIFYKEFFGDNVLRYQPGCCIGKFLKTIHLDVTVSAGRRVFEHFFDVLPGYLHAKKEAVLYGNNSNVLQVVYELSCMKHYYPKWGTLRQSCAIRCQPINPNKMCDDDGREICKKHRYGDDCKKYCEPTRSRKLGYFDCGPNGERICVANKTDCRTPACGSWCMNGGTCVADGPRVRCHCPSRVFGERCESIIDGCRIESEVTNSVCTSDNLCAEEEDRKVNPPQEGHLLWYFKLQSNVRIKIFILLCVPITLTCMLIFMATERFHSWPTKKKEDSEYFSAYRSQSTGEELITNQAH